MIMGNTEIALPAGESSVAINQKKEIPVMPTQQESRSVLGKEVEINQSTPPNKILPNGEPQENRHACGPVRTDSHKC
jgi:hypothetical protein